MPAPLFFRFSLQSAQSVGQSAGEAAVLPMEPASSRSVVVGPIDQPQEPEEASPAEPETAQPAVTKPPREAASDDLDAKIEAIRAQYKSIVFDVNLEARTFGDAATVYLRNGGIVSVASYHMEDPDAVTPKSWTEHYHFSGGAGAPFFVFVEREGYDGWRELRLYFDGRTLLRWIEDDGAPHDNDGSSDYADYYYEEGCLAYANATTALSTS